MEAFRLRLQGPRSTYIIRIGAFVLTVLVAAPTSALNISRLMRDVGRNVATRPAEKLVVPAQEPTPPAKEETQRLNQDTPAANSTAATAAVPNVSEERKPASASWPANEMESHAGLYAVRLKPDEERLVAQAVAQQLGVSRVATFPDIVRHVGTDREALDLKPYVLAGGPLRLLAGTGEFVGSLKIGVATLGLQGRHALSTPLTFQVLDEGIAEPDHIALDHTSPPFATVKIKTSAVRDPYIVRVASEFTPEGIPVSFSVSPTLFLKTDRKVIQGFGLETTDISVYTMGEAKPKGIRVNIETDPSAHLASDQLELDANGYAHTTLRSEDTGTITITASTAGFADVRRQIVFSPPWRTVAASLLGGIMGGFVRLVTTRVKQISRISLSLLTSAVVGLLVFGLTVLGVNVLLLNFAVRVGDVFVLVVSALGGFWGTAALKSLLPPTPATS